VFTTAAIAAVAFFYAVVFAVGAYASRKGDGSAEDLLLAGRTLPLWVGLITMTATWVGGGYINGTAESAYANGPLWGVQAGFGYALSLVLGGLFFAVPMRRAGYTTLVDPFDHRYGRRTAGLMMIPAVMAELFWSAAILVALGSAFSAVLGLPLGWSIAGSSAVAIGYTLVGGMRAVAWTDVVQLGLIVVGLCLALPPIINMGGGWSVVGAKAMDFGFADAADAISYADWSLILMLGGIPWNVYFQRVLSAKDERTSRLLSLGAAPICAAMAIPPLLIGLAATGIDWDGQGLADVGAAIEATPALVLPLTLRHAIPEWMAILGLGAVSAAVMSSVDSSILSASSLATWNGYRRLVDPNATDERLRTVVKRFILGFGVLATLMALTSSSVAALWYLCGDVIYCVLFPQLTLALFDKRSTERGALWGFAVSVTLRMLSGEASLGIPAVVPWPEIAGGEFPFRTFAMLCGFAVTIAVSRLGKGDVQRPA